ncbi:MAG: hypothetical protein H9777_00685 [Candidatus Phocaeicola faecigallinarum]|uniref:Uncharacterized protein n=1 Tax=Candidatus Phocaeicola faecigallinarum TaxID=2838732 RepID=A0A948WWD5_9BACT|nr:hypothetical protein [Candidatus Phocaeicola faecigallinarum]
MSRLSKLYQTMDNLKDLGLSINEYLIQEANELEEEIIKKEILPVLSKTIEPALQPVQRELLLVVDYVPGKPLSVRLSRKRNIDNILTDAVEIKPDPIVAHRSNGPQKAKKEDIAPKTLLRVTMPDGTVLEKAKAKDTFVAVICRIGIERVRPLGLKFCKVPIISNIRDAKYGKAQVPVDGGWLILTHSSTNDKKKQLDKIAKALKIRMKVEIV